VKWSGQVGVVAFMNVDIQRSCVKTSQKLTTEYRQGKNGAGTLSKHIETDGKQRDVKIAYQ